MDLSNRKRKGLGAKGKLAMMSFYRASTSKPPLPSSTILHHHHQQQYTTATSNNMKPSPVKQERVMMRNSGTSPTSSSTTKQRAAVGGSVEFIVNQEQVRPQAKQSVSVVLQDRSSVANIVDSLYGGVAVDESVDVKASTYISTVRERIRLQVLQTINSS